MTGLYLKLIAVLTMLIDHTGDVLFPDQLWLRCIGRIAFPIYCFLLVEGFFHTRDLKKYMLGLFFFGVISEIPFDLAFFGKTFDFNHQNVYWTLLIGLIAISIMSVIHTDNIIPDYALKAAVAVLAGVFAQLIHTDYRWIGVAMIAVMYLFHDFIAIKVALCAVLMLPVFTNQIEYFGLLAFIPIYFYNGRRGYTSRAAKWAFYAFYPVHLLLLVLIKEYGIHQTF